MHDCEYYQELMSRLLDEGLSEEEQTELREHMRTCRDCQRLGAAFTGMTAALREDLAEPPRDLAQGVMERIRDEERSAAPRRRADGPKRRLRPWIRLGAAACLVLVVAGAATATLRSRAKSSQAETADAGSLDMTAAQSRSAGADQSGEEPMTASIGGGAVYDLRDAATGAAEEDAAPADSAPAPVPEENAEAPDPAPSAPQEPLPVYDAARTRIGVIPPENVPAFKALITNEGWAVGTFEYMLKVEYNGKTYAFADSEDGTLVWWEEPSTQPLLSPGTFPQLRQLITMDAPALPQ